MRNLRIAAVGVVAVIALVAGASCAVTPEQQRSLEYYGSSLVTLIVASILLSMGVCLAPCDPPSPPPPPPPPSDVTPAAVEASPSPPSALTLAPNNSPP